jgi:hypothetical protein
MGVAKRQVALDIRRSDIRLQLFQREREQRIIREFHERLARKAEPKQGKGDRGCIQQSAEGGGF